MKKVLAILLLPLLMAMPINICCNMQFNEQNCQNSSKIEKDTCCCVDMQVQPNMIAENSCCCEISNSQDLISLPVLLDIKPIVINLKIDFELTQPIDLSKKINMIENYSSYISAGISSSEKFVLYSPPIYQQYCSLRI